MGLKEDLSREVVTGLAGTWNEEVTSTVPVPQDLQLNAKQLAAATVLYADLDGSTNMVDRYQWSFAAEVYKAYLRCASQIIRSEGGHHSL